MISKELEQRLVKFVNNAADEEDLKMLEQWIRETGNETILRDYVKIHFMLSLGMENPDTNELKELLVREIRKEKHRGAIPLRRSILKYAALFCILLGLGFLFRNHFSNTGKNEGINPKKEAITLQLESGEVIVLDENTTSDTIYENGKRIGTQKGARLVYDMQAPMEKLVYNTLNVPYGRRFALELSDGTRIFLNAGTSLKYPVRFLEGQDRQVFLDGEAFFEVSEDKDRPFTLAANGLDVQVLGTTFNVSGYSDDKRTEVVLIEGTVSLEAENSPLGEKKVILEPGFKGSLNKSQRTISTTKVNTTIYTSWMQGTVVFRNAAFENIVKRLERLYNVTIVNNNKKLATESFNASIEVDRESIEDVLNYFNKVYQIEYTVTDNTIVIN